MGLSYWDVFQSIFKKENSPFRGNSVEQPIDARKRPINRAHAKGVMLLKRHVSAFSAPSLKSLLRTPS